jgi:hypothetical protein
MHNLAVRDDRDDQDTVVLTIVNYPPKDISLRDRIHAAWAVLRGDEHVYSEIFLPNDELVDFVKWAMSLTEETK